MQITRSSYLMEIDLQQNAENVIAQLRELAQLTSNEDGAQRVAWTPVWDRAVEWFKIKMKTHGAQIYTDAAQNVWAKLKGQSDDAIVIGSHLDCVPNGGWLDGALGVVTGMQILSSYAEHNIKPKRTLYVVNWADEEGARFGCSCVGSSAVSGALDMDRVKNMRDNNGICFLDMLKMYQVDPDTFPEAKKEFLTKNIKGYLELHIEQGPVLEQKNKAIACVQGITSCKRQYITFNGQASHSGSPMNMRHDAFLAAAQASIGFNKLAQKYDAYCTVGKVEAWPNVVTIFPGKCRISLDQRSVDADILDSMAKEAVDIASRAADQYGVEVDFEPIWFHPPTIFDAGFISSCCEAITEETGDAAKIISGPLHDAAEIAKMVPSVMMFAMSERGLSHCKEENTPDDKLKTAVRAFSRLADKALNM